MIWNLSSFKTADDFLAFTSAFLEKEEAINGLLLGLSLANKGKKEDKSLYVTIKEKEEIVFTAIKTEGRNLIVYGKDPNAYNYVPTFLTFLQKEKITIPGIIGPSELVIHLGTVLKNDFGWEYKMGFRHLVYVLKEVKYNPQREGQLIKADRDRIEHIAQWMHWFSKEALNEDDQKGALEAARKKIGKGEVYLWLDPEAVTMTCASRPTINGITINYVYTPLEHRNKGYGTKLVAELSTMLLAKGYTFCTLFADIENPTSNSIYKKIGYEPVGEFSYLQF